MMRKHCFSSNHQWMMMIYMLSKISGVNKAHETWKILKHEYMGAQKVILVKLQTLRQQFETLSMEQKETVQEYLDRVSTIVNQMKVYGEFRTNENSVSKVLRSPSLQFEYVVPAIIESNDLSTYTFDEMMSFLMAHEDRLSKANEKTGERAFQENEDSLENRISGYYGSQDREKGGYHGRGRGYGKERSGSMNRINTKIHTKIKVITSLDTRISSRRIFNVGIARSLGKQRLSAGPNKGMS